ncbi:MAG TPA: transaldolase [Candidatus Bathyarchaeota archaeon]|nr:transaldolase [Candidatus Bathyarchaeota archaeon]
MKIFIDTADIDEIKEACSWGVIDGATTNPSLIRRAVERRGGKVSMEEYIRQILEVVPGPVSLEVTATDVQGMVRQARILNEKFGRYGEVVVKIPVNPSLDFAGSNDFDGLKAIRVLENEGIATNATLIMTPEQALLAAKAGATYASPFAGRIDDYIRSRLGLKPKIDFQKGDYFDSDLLLKIGENRIYKIINEKNGSLQSLYMDEDVRNLRSLVYDNGVYSGVDLLAKVLRIYRNYGFKTEIIASSIRNARQVREVAELGVHIATLPFHVIKQMVRHPKTVEGMRIFTADTVPSYKKIFE